MQLVVLEKCYNIIKKKKKREKKLHYMNGSLSSDWAEQ